MRRRGADSKLTAVSTLCRRALQVRVRSCLVWAFAGLLHCCSLCPTRGATTGARCCRLSTWSCCERRCIGLVCMRTVGVSTASSSARWSRRS
ncbi:hypothetical protein C8R44DRAFT_765472 [Mycena epipterygia]|nr:hypothetical protein C8R44DRAFT_765472 [Mycena epipterygia]